MEEKTVIHFYKKTTPYFEFSNFARYPISIDGFTWPTSEHYFQAMKFPDDPSLQEKIRKNKKPLSAFIEVRKEENRSKRRPDWSDIKVDVMRKAVLNKFSQHKELKELLLTTGDAILVEHTIKDAFWGDGGGDGLNMLGKILMEVREKLKETNGPDTHNNNKKL